MVVDKEYSTRGRCDWYLSRVGSLVLIETQKKNFTVQSMICMEPYLLLNQNWMDALLSSTY